TNHITIKDGQVSMSYSTCRNQVCVNTGAISQTKDAIVCLPNRVVVEIISSEEGKGGDADVISG
ncbi:MAG: NusG domain II-containing protein, partial [Anaerovoracaceae bacterium]